MPRTLTPPTPLRIVFACHANYDYGTRTLNEDGIDKSHGFAAVLKEKGFGGDKTLILTSPDHLAYSTAQIIGGDIGTVATIDKRLAQDLMILHPYDSHAIEAECREWRRYAEFIEKLPAKFRDVVVVTHQPNVLGFTRQFASAGGNEYFIPRLSGAVMYSIDAARWNRVDYRERQSARVEMRHYISETRQVPARGW